MHIINAPILIVNIFLFAFSSWSLCCGVWASEKVGRDNIRNKNRTQTVTRMFFVVGITWIAEVVSFLLNYGLGYNNGIPGEGASLHTNAIVIKVSFLFDCINAFQGIIMFAVLFLDQQMVKRIGKYLKPNEKKTRHKAMTSPGTRKSETSFTRIRRNEAVKFDHHAQQLTIRTNRTWRTPSPQPSPGLLPITTQVELTEEFATNELPRSVSEDSFETSTKQKHVTTVDFTMQFP